ncbi:MAG: type II CRISPR RNA-guided endonuclease Cas9, partial [Clostridia bacterium]|nr:type II CRISPR RNA-guided endonuclease Cas9 [Clostridia bacterium]
MEKFLQNYFLGLDIGTTSCGFAVTDENYNVVRAKGKKLWGVRLFEEAETASSRRLKRSSRRRLERRKLKLAWLNEIFAKEIAKVDKDFYDRIKYSPLFVEDKKAQNKDLGKYSLFDCEIDGKKYTDRDFYKDYKSIYHLRKELLSTPAKDIRFLYLAIHSIIKRRGHFLYEGDFADNASVLESVNDLVTYVNTLPLDASISLEELSEQNEKKLLKIVADGFKKKDAK